MNLYSRKIIAWTLSQTLEVSCVIHTINKAKARRSIKLPLIIHSDRGSQYVSQAYREATAKMQRSYSKKAFPWDNACIESFHALIKREWLNLFKIRSSILKPFIIPNGFIVIAITCHQMTLKNYMSRHRQTNCS